MSVFAIAQSFGHETLQRVIDARRIYSARMTQLDSLG